MGGKAGRKSTYEVKTKPTKASVGAFIGRVSHARRREEAHEVLALMTEISGQTPEMWGESIIGFGRYHYRTRSGCEADWPRLAFSPRKSAMTIYLMPGFSDKRALLAKLGPHKTSVSCLYISNLAKIDMSVLRTLIEDALETMNKRYPPSS